MINITLPNGDVVDNYSSEYRIYCEAKWLSKQNFQIRKEWMEKVKEKRKNEIKLLEKYLNLVFSLKQTSQNVHSNIIMP